MRCWLLIDEVQVLAGVAVLMAAAYIWGAASNLAAFALVVFFVGAAIFLHGMGYV
jgi:hypothetical protein